MLGQWKRQREVQGRSPLQRLVSKHPPILSVLLNQESSDPLSAGHSDPGEQRALMSEKTVPGPAGPHGGGN